MPEINKNDPRYKAMQGNQNQGYKIEDALDIEKKSKILYYEVDVLEVLKAEMAKRPKGWASAFASDLFRDVFEKNGLFEANGVTNIRKAHEEEKKKAQQNKNK